MGFFLGNEGAFSGFQRSPLDQVDKPFPFRPGNGAVFSETLSKEREKNGEKADFHKISRVVFEAGSWGNTPWDRRCDSKGGKANRKGVGSASPTDR